MQKQKLTTKQKKELADFIRHKDTTADEVRRAQAVLITTTNVDEATIITFTGYSQRHAWRLKAQYLKVGREALTDKRQGDPKPLLTKKQRHEVLTVLKTKQPDEVGYVGAGWTTRMLGDYIKREYKAQYKSRTSYYLLFKDAKFTYHKPERRYEKHDEEAVKKWRKRAKRRIRQVWHDPTVEVICEDEMVLSTQTTVQKVWLPAGKYPKIDVSNNRQSRSLYGFLNVKTGQEHVWKTKRQNMHETVKILKKLRKLYPKQKLLLLWDSAPWHLGSKVKEWLESDGQVTTLAFPRYAPEENPQEHVWKAGRAAVTHNRFLDDIDEATNDFYE